jgi:hypothetical protein
MTDDVCGRVTRAQQTIVNTLLQLHSKFFSILYVSVFLFLSQREQQDIYILLQIDLEHFTHWKLTCSRHNIAEKLRSWR